MYRFLGKSLQTNGLSRSHIGWRGAVAVAARRGDEEMAKPFEQMPSATMVPFIGTAWTFMPIIGKYRLDEQHLAFQKKKQQFGDVVRDKFGSFDMVVSFRAEDLETILKNEGLYPSRGEFISIKKYRESRKQWFTTTGIVVLEGKEWYDLRTKVQKHLMKPKAVQAYLNPMQDVAKDLVQKIREIRNADKEIPDLMPELNKWSLESVAMVGLDTRLGCLRQDLPPGSDGVKMIRSVHTQMECINKLESITGNIPFWKIFPTPTWKKFTREADIFCEIAFKYINRALEDIKKIKDDEDKELTLLQNMLLTKGLDASKAMVTVADMLMAGIDTTSHTVAFLLYHLAKNPEHQEKLHQELCQLLPSKEDRITSEVFGQLKYLKACLKESQRLLPIAGLGMRRLDKEVIISGYRVPAGTTILVALLEIGKDERYFEDPLRFSPERWMNREQKPHPYAFLPFGFGTRSCVGRRLAELEILCLTAHLIRNFRVEYHHGELGLKTRFIMTPDRPLQFKFLER